MKSQIQCSGKNVERILNMICRETQHNLKVRSYYWLDSMILITTTWVILLLQPINFVSGAFQPIIKRLML